VGSATIRGYRAARNRGCPRAYSAPMPQARTMRLNPPAVVLLIVAVVFAAVSIYFFASPPSHPRRGVVFVVLAIGCLVGAWLFARRPRAKT
jgi:hypothetical protein